MLTRLVPDNLLRNNVATVQLLGLCPLLAVSYSVETASMLAVASAFVLIFSSIAVSTVRKFIPSMLRLPSFVLIISTFTTIVVLLAEAFVWSLYVQVALFVQIIVTNCMILGRINQVASSERLATTFLDALSTSLGFAVVLILLSAIREFGALALPILIYPTGAFLVFGLLLALQQLFQPTDDVSESNTDTATTVYPSQSQL